jgi:porin
VEDVESPIALDNGVPPVQGFGLFARAGIGDDDTNPIEWTVSGGFGGQGVIPGRDHDLFGIGYSYAGLQTNRLTGSLGFHDNSQAFEAFYSLAITPAAQLTFDLQVVRGPAPLLDAAVILGMRLYLDF